MDRLLLCDTCVIMNFLNEHDLVLQALRDNQWTLFINATIEMDNVRLWQLESIADSQQN